MLTLEDLTYARRLESELRPIQAMLTALAHGGADSHRQALPGVSEAIHALPGRLAGIAAWARANAPDARSRCNDSKDSVSR